MREFLTFYRSQETYFYVGVVHRSLRIQSGAHPHLRKIQENAQSHDTNPNQCHFSPLERNDTSCLPKRIVRSLYALSQFITPCNCTTSCSKYPESLTAPCRNALNNTEPTAPTGNAQTGSRVSSPTFSLFYASSAHPLASSDMRYTIQHRSQRTTS